MLGFEAVLAGAAYRSARVLDKRFVQGGAIPAAGRARCAVERDVLGCGQYSHAGVRECWAEVAYARTEAVTGIEGVSEEAEAQAI